MTYTITHGPDGTRLDGTAKGDGTRDLLRGWLWSRRESAWVLNSTWKFDTRDQKVRATVAAFTAAGLTVEVDREDAPAVTSAADVAAEEAALAERFDRIADRHEAAAERAEQTRDAADATFRRIGDSIPMGQPILVGHHSERRHRKDLGRMENALRTSVESNREAEDRARRAESALARSEQRTTVPAMLTRIEKLEVERRDLDRKINGSGKAIYGLDKPATGGYRDRLLVRLAETDARLAYWRAKVTEAEADGARVWTRADFKPGDWVKVRRYGWLKVEKANPKNLKARSYHADGRPVMPWALDYKYADVLDRREADAAAADLAPFDKEA